MLLLSTFLRKSLDTKLPKRGSKVKLKGRNPFGVIKTMDEESKWVHVEWNKNTPGPKYCHLYELEEIT